MKKMRFISLLVAATLVVTQANTTVLYASEISSIEPVADYEADDVENTDREATVEVEAPEDEQPAEEQTQGETEYVEEEAVLPEAEVDVSEEATKIDITISVEGIDGARLVNTTTGDIYEQKSIADAYSLDKKREYTVGSNENETIANIRAEALGKRFVKWTYLQAGETEAKEYKSGVVLTKATTITPVFEAVEYSLKRYNLAPPYEPVLADPGEEKYTFDYEIPTQNSYSREYSFAGWFTSDAKDAKEVTKLGDAVANPYSGEEETVNVYGRWIKKNVITFNNGMGYSIMDAEGNNLGYGAKVLVDKLRFKVVLWEGTKGTPVVKVNGSLCQPDKDGYYEADEVKGVFDIYVSGIERYIKIVDNTSSRFSKYYTLKAASYDSSKPIESAFNVSNQSIKNVKVDDNDSVCFAVEYTNQMRKDSNIGIIGPCLDEYFDGKKQIKYFRIPLLSDDPTMEINLYNFVDKSFRAIDFELVGEFPKDIIRLREGGTNIHFPEENRIETEKALNFKITDREVAKVTLDGKVIKPTYGYYDIPASDKDQKVTIELAKTYKATMNSQNIDIKGGSVNVNPNKDNKLVLEGVEYDNIVLTDSKTKKTIETEALLKKDEGILVLEAVALSKYAGKTIGVAAYEKAGDRTPVIKFNIVIQKADMTTIKVDGVKSANGLYTLTQIPGTTKLYKISGYDKDINENLILVCGDSKSSKQARVVRKDKNLYLEFVTDVNDDKSTIMIGYDGDESGELDEAEVKLKISYKPDLDTLSNAKPSVKVVGSTHKDITLELSCGTKALEDIVKTREVDETGLFYVIEGTRKEDGKDPEHVMVEKIEMNVPYQIGKVQFVVPVKHEQNRVDDAILSEYNFTAKLVQAPSIVSYCSKSSNVVKGKTIVPAYAKSLTINQPVKTIYTGIEKTENSVIAIVGYDSNCTYRNFKVVDDGNLDLEVRDSENKIVVKGIDKQRAFETTRKITIESDAPDGYKIQKSFNVKVVNSIFYRDAISIQYPQYLYVPYRKTTSVQPTVDYDELYKDSFSIKKQIKSIEYALVEPIEGVSINARNGKITIDKKFNYNTSKIEIKAIVKGIDGRNTIYTKVIVINSQPTQFGYMCCDLHATPDVDGIYEACDLSGTEIIITDIEGLPMDDDYTVTCNKKGYAFFENHIYVEGEVQPGDVVFTATARDGSGAKISTTPIKTKVTYGSIPAVTFVDDEDDLPEEIRAKSFSLSKEGTVVDISKYNSKTINLNLDCIENDEVRALPKGKITVTGGSVYLNDKGTYSAELQLKQNAPEMTVKLGQYKLILVNNKISQDKSSIRLKKNNLNIYYNTGNGFSIDSTELIANDKIDLDQIDNIEWDIDNNKYRPDYTKASTYEKLEPVIDILLNMEVEVENDHLFVMFSKTNSLKGCAGKYYASVILYDKAGKMLSAPIPITVTIADASTISAKTKLNTKYTYKTKELEIKEGNTVAGEKLYIQSVTSVKNNYGIVDNSVQLTRDGEHWYINNVDAPRDGKKHTYNLIVKYYIEKDGNVLPSRTEKITIDCTKTTDK